MNTIGIPSRAPAPKPQLLVCYLCGQQFGSASLGIHVPQCYNKKLRQWQAGDPATRGKKPRHPDSVECFNSGKKTVQEFNDQQFRDFSDNLEPCPNCGRKFLPDRLQVHLRSCNPDRPGGGSRPIARGGEVRQEQSSPTGSPNSPIRRSAAPKSKPKGPTCKPQLLVCYLCGQQFGSASLGIHVPQCYEKKIKQWCKGDPATRGKKPRHPDTVEWQASEDQSLEDFNNQQFRDFSDNLELCPNCGRKFLPDRLQVHLRSCNADKPGGGSRPVRSPGSPVSRSTSASTKGSVTSPLQSGKLPPLGRVGSPRGSSPGGRGAAPSSRTQSLKCITCGCVEYDMAAKFCRDCGKPLARESSPSQPRASASEKKKETSTCPYCSSACDAGVRVCSTCGSIINEEAPARKKQPATPGTHGETCPSCEKIVEGGANFCDDCGCRIGVAAQRPPTPKIIQMKCPTCGEIFDDGANFCEQCGDTLVPCGTESTSPLSPEAKDVGKLTLPPLKSEGGSPVSSPSLHSRSKPPLSPRPGARPSASPPPKRAAPPRPAAVEEGDEASDTEERAPCSICGRSFALHALERHEQFCSKQQSKKRKVFDSRKLRMQGTEAAGYIRKVAQQEKAPEPKKSAAQWREQSQEFRAAMKAARDAEKIIKAGGKLSDLPPPPPSLNSDYITCPHCSRRFNQQVAERHIPRCATTISRPKPPPKRRF